MFQAAVPAENTEVIVTSIYECDGPVPISESNIELKDGDDEKWVEFTFETDSLIDSTYTANLTIDQWKNGAWQENVYSTEGSMCELKNKFIPKAWKKLAEATEPQSDPEDCNIQPVSV
nr:unnamed protein product [Callosobruchus analis]